MTPPTWLDAAGRRRPRLACWTCGREVAPMRFAPLNMLFGDTQVMMGWTQP
jgi:hypothetical protein